VVRIRLRETAPGCVFDGGRHTALKLTGREHRMRIIASALVAVTALVTTAAPPAQSQTSFYEGKTINIVVGFSPGGGYDRYARLLARHIGKHIPGKPSAVVQNMPGAGSLVAVRHLDTTAPRDGTVIVAFNPGLIMESLTEPEKVKLNFSNLAWIGSISRDMRVCYAWHATGLKTWDDIVKRDEFIIGGTAPGSSSYNNSATLKNVFGLKIRRVLGYPGSAEQRLAIERGELEGDCGSWSSINPEWRQANKVNPFVRFSKGKAPDLPDVPFVGDFAKTPEQKEVIQFLTSVSEFGTPVVMSKQVPSERLEVIRKAFDETMRDPEFLAEAQKSQLPVDPIPAGEAGEIIESIYKSPPELIVKARDALK
jgi:tripartite-type tricarboxylate transporter receptor subunit TctC